MARHGLWWLVTVAVAIPFIVLCVLAFLADKADDAMAAFHYWAWKDRYAQRDR